MNSRLMTFALGLSVLLNVSIAAGFAYRVWLAPPFPSVMPGPPGSAPSPIEAMSRDLNLDAEQRKILIALLDDYAPERRKRTAEIVKVREQIVAEMQQPQLRADKLEVLVDQMTRLRADQLKEYMRTIADFEPRLRPEQREKMQVLLAERFMPVPLNMQGPPNRPRP